MQWSGAVKSNRHNINVIANAVGENLGLSGYEEARRDMKNQLARRLSFNYFDLLPEEIRSLTCQLLEHGFKANHHEEWLATLKTSILEETDERLSFDHIKDYMLNKFYKETSNEVLLMESQKPIASDPGSFDRIEFYSQSRKQFLDKYLPQVLHDLGFLIVSPEVDRMLMVLNRPFE